MRFRTRRQQGFTLVELLTVLSLIAMIAAIIMPRFFMARDTSAYTACGQNLKTLATALQTYANNNDQQYPPDLGSLVTGGFLGTLPTCPDAKGADTYSPSYEASVTPPNFTVFCSGSFHIQVIGIQPNEPYYYLGSGGLGPNR